LSRQKNRHFISGCSLPCQFTGAFANFERQLNDARKAKDNTKYKGIMQRAALFYDGTVFPVNSKKYQ
jgi:hypothetical protein